MSVVQVGLALSEFGLFKVGVQHWFEHFYSCFSCSDKAGPTCTTFSCVSIPCFPYFQMEIFSHWFMHAWNNIQDHSHLHNMHHVPVHWTKQEITEALLTRPRTAVYLVITQSPDLWESRHLLCQGMHLSGGGGGVNNKAKQGQRKTFLWKSKLFLPKVHQLSRTCILQEAMSESSLFESRTIQTKRDVHGFLCRGGVWWPLSGDPWCARQRVRPPPWISASVTFNLQVAHTLHGILAWFIYVHFPGCKWLVTGDCFLREGAFKYVLTQVPLPTLVFRDFSLMLFLCARDVRKKRVRRTCFAKKMTSKVGVCLVQG